MRLYVGAAFESLLTCFALKTQSKGLTGWDRMMIFMYMEGRTCRRTQHPRVTTKSRWMNGTFTSSLRSSKISIQRPTSNNGSSILISQVVIPVKMPPAKKLWMQGNDKGKHSSLKPKEDYQQRSAMHQNKDIQKKTQSTPDPSPCLFKLFDLQFQHGFNLEALETSAYHNNLVTLALRFHSPS